MVFVTYAQNFEDLMLFRALGSIERGFYIDVGANLPEAESVTKAFYDRNWSGVNIEPEPDTFLKLAAARTRDVNIAQACWREAGIHTLYLVEESAAFSTLEPGMAELHRQAGRKVREVLLETTTLRDVCAEHVGTRPIHFLKVDVEGGELGVFAGADFNRWRPWIILAEAHGPDFLSNVYQPWEDLLHQFCYRFVYTDGLNRFYLAEEHYDHLSPAFRCPPNVYDNWVRASEIAANERAECAERMCAELRTHHENAKRQIEFLWRAMIDANLLPAFPSRFSPALPTKPFISYAPNGEDVMLYRALRGVERGFYVDVGAGEPEAGSVTCAFHQRGWRGINLEPAPGAFERLATARPDDINLNIVVGDRNGDDGDGLSTTVSGQIESQREHRLQNTKINLPVRTLTSIFAEYVNGTVHFLKIGVGGGERVVLAGMDLRRFRPWIVLVEATSPTSGIPTHQDWEHLLLDADYRFVWFDGLNRFYLSAEKTELAAALGVQPNVFDGFIRSTEADAIAQLAQARPSSLNPAAGKRQPNPARNMAQIEIAAQRSRSDELENEVVRLEAERDAWMQDVFEANRHAAHVMQAHQTSLDYIHRLERKLRRQPTYVLVRSAKTLWKMGRRRLRSVAKRLGKW